MLGLYASDSEFDYQVSLDELVHAGANSVLMVMHLDQEDVASAAVSPPSDESLKRMSLVSRQGRARGLRTAVIPIVNLGHLAPGKWRGTLDPPDWTLWFDSYRAALSEIARVASSSGVELLCIGSELCSSEAHEGEWRRIIAEVRKIFPGKLTYSANWDHLPRDGFVQELDYLGLNAYYELLCHEQDGSLPTLLTSWRRIQDDVIGPWQSRLERPILFLEVGYESASGADRHPWDYTLKGPADVLVQERLYAAFIEAWRDWPGLAGTFFYVWWEGPHRDETGYTPRGKPAGELMRSWYRSQSGQRRSPPR